MPRRVAVGATRIAGTVTATAIIAVALAAAVVPLPPSVVEHVYSTGLYPLIQRSLTSISNRSSVALIDIVLVIAVVWLIFVAARVPRLFHAGTVAGFRKLIIGLSLPAAGLYLWFVILWGFNYRRLPL